MESFADLWSLVQQELQQQLSEVIYNVWLKELEPISFEDSTAVLAIPEFKRKIVEQKFMNVLHDAFEKTLGFDVEVKLVEPKGHSEEKTESKADVSAANNTFDTFVIGPSNKFAHAAAQAVSANPGKAYNPLFIYGNSGLGKTHLLRAIGNAIKADNPDANIVYTQGDAFTNDLIEYIGKKDMVAFHNKFRNADVLLVDDVQFIAGKEQTQEEFFHTFNAIYQAGNQIVLTSDKPPKEIPTLEERLRTRFVSGLIADIQPPDIETRIAIIKGKAKMLELDIPDEVVQFIAEKLKSNIRQLEGAVQKMQAFAEIHGSSPSIITAQTAIKDILSESRPAPVTVTMIIEEVARTYGADPADIRSKKRDAETSRMRQIAMYVVSEITGISTKSIGKEFGGRDHSTVIYGLKEIKREMQRDSSLRATVNDIIKNIQEKA